MQDLNQLNEEIKEQELRLFELSEQIASKHMEFEVSLLEETTSLESVYKETKDINLSNQQKREQLALNKKTIRESSNELRRLKKGFEIKKIELSYLKRKFRLELAILEVEQ